jgi:hypothetical protein
MANRAINGSMQGPLTGVQTFAAITIAATVTF